MVLYLLLQTRQIHPKFQRALVDQITVLVDTRINEKNDERKHSRFKSLIGFRDALTASRKRRSSRAQVVPAVNFPLDSADNDGSAVEDGAVEEKNETVAERLERLQRELSSKDAALASKDAELARMLQSKDAELSRKDAELTRKDTEMSEMATMLASKDAELARNLSINNSELVSMRGGRSLPPLSS